MSQIRIALVATCGVLVGTVFACQPNRAAQPVSGGAVAGKEPVIGIAPNVIRPEEAQTVRGPAIGSNKSTTNRAVPAPPTAASQDAKAVVARFLEALRKGDNQTATKLLTKVARQKAQESGVSVAPPASETARVAVDNIVYPTPDHNLARVPSRWIDLDDSNQLRTDKATWICRKEPDGWRIAGFDAFVFEGEKPLFLSFEDPDDLAKKQRWLTEEIARRAKQNPSAAGEKKVK